MQNVTDDNFQELIKSNEYVLVDFYAEWCQPCKALMKHLDSVKDDYAILTIVKANIEECQTPVKEAGIRQVPTLHMYHNGVLKAERSGAMPEGLLRKWIAEVMR